MNYITEIKGFYDLVMIKPMSTGQIALWHTLMYINNKCAWTEWFTVPNSTLELLTGLCRKTIYNARNSLKQSGLIDFRANGTKASSYKMISLLYFTQEATQNNAQTYTQDLTQGTTQNTATLNKQNETKPNKENIKEELSPGLSAALEAFADMRKKLKKPLTAKAKELTLLKLQKLSEPYADKDGYMIQSLEQSILNGWQGVFEVKGFIDKPPECEALPDSGPKLFNPGDSIEDYL